MKITCNTVEEFLDNVNHDKADVVRNEIWIRTDEMPASEHNDLDWHVFVWLTVVIDRETCPYILEFGKHVGDYITGGGEDATTFGRDEAQRIVDQVGSACKGLGMKTRAGKVEIYTRVLILNVPGSGLSTKPGSPNNMVAQGLPFSSA